MVLYYLPKKNGIVRRAYPRNTCSEQKDHEECRWMAVDDIGTDDFITVLGFDNDHSAIGSERVYRYD